MKDFKCPYCGTLLTSEVYWGTLKKIRKEGRQKSESMRQKLKAEIKEREAKLKEHYKEQHANKLEQLGNERRLVLESERHLKLERKSLSLEKKGIRKSIKAKVEKGIRLKYSKKLTSLKNREKLLEKMGAERGKALKKEFEQKFERKYRQKEIILNQKKKELEEKENDIKKQKIEMRNSIKRNLGLEYSSKLQKEKNKYEKKRRELDDKESRLNQEMQDIKDGEELKVKSLEKTIGVLKQESERKSSQELGDIPEDKLIDTLKNELPGDLFERVGKGRRGGDIIETIMFNNRPIGRILYESKNDKNWKNSWINKIREDRVSIGTPYAILVSKAFPRNTKHFAIVKGIPVVSPRLLPHLARIIRGSIIAIEKQKLSAFEKEEKVGLLYSYLNSNKFKSSAMSIGESIENLNKIRFDERNVHEKTWTKQEHEVSNISKNFAKIHSNIETIIEKEPIQIEFKTNNNKKRLLKKAIS